MAAVELLSPIASPVSPLDIPSPSNSGAVRSSVQFHVLPHAALLSSYPHAESARCAAGIAIVGRTADPFAKEDWNEDFDFEFDEPAAAPLPRAESEHLLLTRSLDAWELLTEVLLLCGFAAPDTRLGRSGTLLGPGSARPHRCCALLSAHADQLCVLAFCPVREQSHSCCTKSQQAKGRTARRAGFGSYKGQILG